MTPELRGNIGTSRLDLEALITGIGNKRFNQLARHTAPADFGRDQGMFGHPRSAALHPGQPPDRRFARHMGTVFAGLIIAMTGDGNLAHTLLLA